MRKIIKVVLIMVGVVICFFIVSKAVDFFVTTPSPFGFILPEHQDTWINFYGALLGGTLTLLGVWWTIYYTEETRKEDQKKHENEIKDEFDRRNKETKRNLSAQYKPILTIAFNVDHIPDAKYGMSKYEDFVIQNNIGLVDIKKCDPNEKRLVVSLSVLNIGRGEAKDLIIYSSVMTPEGECWETIDGKYQEIYVSNGINIFFYKVLDEKTWEKYKNCKLEKPFIITIKIDYKDLVGYEHSLSSKIFIKKFIPSINEDQEYSKNALVSNPYDSTIENETYDHEQIIDS
ncbi:MAG: hypothetical protein IKK03_09345 [Lachnospiraceae bacterium]|nr:hypothetical protein [Lachnospiraceae bacterium]